MKPTYIKLSYSCPYCQGDWFEILEKTEKHYKLNCLTCHKECIGEFKENMANDNFLKNPTFELPYSPQDGIGELQIAEGWRAGWDNSKKRPEWRRSAPNWDNSQQWFVTSDLADGWIYQTLKVGKENVGKYFELVVTCALESKNVGSGIGDFFVSIGIDRWGNGNVNSKTVVWTSPLHQSVVPKWTELKLIAPIENEWITVYIQNSNKWKVNGSIFVKSAYGYVVDSICPDMPSIPETPTPPPLDGECLFDASSILLAIQGARSEIKQAKDAILQAIDSTVKITDCITFER